MRLFVLDMDQSFYNPHAPFARVMAELRAHGFAANRIEGTLTEANARGYSFELHLELLGVPDQAARVYARRWAQNYEDGSRFLLPGVESAIATLPPEDRVMLVTFGDERFQRQKWDGLPEAFRERFVATHFVLEPKGPTLARIAAQARPGEEVIFADDSPSHLFSTRQHAPGVRCVRMMWPQFGLKAHEGDGVEWRVATNIDELVRL